MKYLRPSSLHRRALTFTVCAIVAVFAAGCGSEPGGNGPDPKSDAARLDLVTKLRDYYTKANGDYSKLSETDKAEFVKLVGGEDKAQASWQQMSGGAAPADTHDAPPAGG